MIGEIVGSYRIVKPLGHGGMGEVFVAEHTLIGRRAAVKMLRPGISSDPELVARFFNEARAAALIRHPGLVDVFDFGRHPNGSAFLVMELLEGETLAARLAGSEVPEELLVGIARQVAAAVDAAHAQGIVHRDLKPDNLFLVADDDMPLGVRVKVLDFGIAKLGGDRNAAGLKTSTSAILGTPVYMSPEQCRGAGSVDHRADIYSLGCILYEMACGQPPFVRDGVGELIAAHLAEAPPSLRSLRPGIRLELEQLIVCALKKAPAERPQTMAEVVAALDRIPLAGGQLASARRSLARPPALGALPGSPGDALANAATLGATAAAASPATASAAHLALAATVGNAPVSVAPSPTAEPSRPAFSTTLGGTASESLALRSAPNRRRWRVPAAAALGVAAALATAMVLRPARPTRVAQPAPAARATTTAAPSTILPRLPPPVSPKAVHLALRSLPAGAAVYRLTDGAYLGETPLSYAFAPTAGTVAFTLKREGFEDRQVTLAADHDSESSVDLLPARRLPSAARPRHSPAATNSHGADDIVDVYK